MEADALGDAYVPPARFVSLLKRLEARRGAGGEAGAEASGERSHGAAQRTPSPADFDRYTVAVRTAPARTPALARNRGGGGGTLAADADGELDLSKLAGDASLGEVTHLALLRHDHAVEAYGERRAVVDAALTAQRRMDFYVTTAEADARRRNEQDPQEAAPSDSNYEAIAEKLGITFRHTIEKRIASAESVGAHKTSMLQDVEAGRSLETEALIGAILELGKMTETPAPAIEAFYACVKLLTKVMLLEGAGVRVSDAA